MLRPGDSKPPIEGRSICLLTPTKIKLGLLSGFVTMATRKSQLFASLVLELMSDGKERTITQISTELDATSAQV